MMKPRMVQWFVLLERLLRASIALLMALLISLTFVQVVARYVMHSPFTGTDQLSRIALVWLTFIAAAVAVREDKNIRIEFLLKHLPPKVAQWNATALDLLLVGFLSVFSVRAYEVTRIGFFQHILATPFSYAAIYSSIFAGSLLMLLFVVLRILNRHGILEFRLSRKDN